MLFTNYEKRPVNLVVVFDKKTGDVVQLYTFSSEYAASADAWESADAWAEGGLVGNVYHLASRETRNLYLVVPQTP